MQIEIVSHINSRLPNLLSNFDKFSSVQILSDTVKRQCIGVNEISILKRNNFLIH